jgi:uncharacterized protein YrrD
MNLQFGSTVRCTDGPVRELADLVVDGPGRRVTHLVVEPKGHHEGARLVPLELAGEDAKGMSLSCTAEMLEGFEAVHEYAYLPAGTQPEESAEWSVGVEDVLVAPSYEPLNVGETEFDPNISLMYDRVPKGEVELRGSSEVRSADGHRVGSVHGLEIDAEGRIEALRLQRGHLWWKRHVAVPADSIASFETDLVTLAVDKDDVSRVSAGRARRAMAG